MNRDEIIKLSEKNISEKNIDEVKSFLEKNYEISYGRYNDIELKKALNNKTPFYINNYFIVGYDRDDQSFVSDKNEKVKIDRMVKAVIVEDIASVANIDTVNAEDADFLAIIDKNEWDDISEFETIISPIRLNRVFLPSHSIVFNFINQSEEEKKERIVSYMEGVKICILEKNNYIDNCFHEIGHVFWRDCVPYEFQQQYKRLFKTIKPSSLIEFKWETSDPEEYFCTVYKWYMKAMFLNPNFMNILEFEEPKGFDLFLQILQAIKEKRKINDLWELSKQDVFNFVRPKVDRSTGQKIMMKGVAERALDTIIPESVVNENLKYYKDGKKWIQLNKAIVPIDHNNKIIKG